MMRSLTALRLIQTGSRASHVVYRGGRTTQAIRNGYCSSCETTSSPIEAGSTTTKAKSTTTPPTPPPADHRVIGLQQELFISSIYSPGSPIFLPHGTRIFNKLTNFLRAQYEQFGFDEVISPIMYKESLWKLSGHWENYADAMYSVTGRGAAEEEKWKKLREEEGKHSRSKATQSPKLRREQELEDEAYSLKPMNCPGHCLIYASKQRSYRDLPIRYADFSPLHRNEVSGALSGLTRVRRFHQDDGHIFCRPSQIQEEISKTLDFVKLTYHILGLGPYRLTLSTRPKEHFIGNEKEWDAAESALRESLNASGQDWSCSNGDGAFYGPKIDIILQDSDGKEHQTATIQLDFQLPKRFGLNYHTPTPEDEWKDVGRDPKGPLDPSTDGLSISTTPGHERVGEATPVLIHRAVLGSVERIMALLIEQHKGKWPFWLNPRQIIILTVNDKPATVAFAREAMETLQNSKASSWPLNEIRGKLPADFPTPALLNAAPWSVKIDDSSRTLLKKLLEARKRGYGVVAVVGEDNVKSKVLNVDFTGIPNCEIFGQYQSIREALSVVKASSSSQKKIDKHPPPLDQIVDPKQGGERAPDDLKKQLRNVPLLPSRLKSILLHAEGGYI